MRAVTDFLVLLSIFVREAVTVNENVYFTDCFQNPASGLLQFGHKSGK